MSPFCIKIYFVISCFNPEIIKTRLRAPAKFVLFDWYDLKYIHYILPFTVLTHNSAAEPFSGDLFRLSKETKEEIGLTGLVLQRHFMPCIIVRYQQIC